MKVHLPDDTITNTQTGESMDVVTETNEPVSKKDILIGGGLIIGGVWWLVKSAFRNGCKEYQQAEFNTLDALHLIKS